MTAVPDPHTHDTAVEPHVRTVDGGAQPDRDGSGLQEPPQTTGGPSGYPAEGEATPDALRAAEARALYSWDARLRLLADLRRRHNPCYCEAGQHDPGNPHRQARDICRSEGHGELAEITGFGDLPNRRYLCQRGCGVDIIDLAAATTLDEAADLTKRQGTVTVRGRVEVWPASDGALGGEA
jgi:hypothetical protein